MNYLVVVTRYCWLGFDGNCWINLEYYRKGSLSTEGSAADQWTRLHGSSCSQQDVVLTLHENESNGCARRHSASYFG